MERNILLTCEVCGYRALLPGAIMCDHCQSEVWEDYMMERGYHSKKHYLREAQLTQFRIKEELEPVQFFEPKVADGYEKDLQWSPLVSEEEVRIHSRQYWYKRPQPTPKPESQVASRLFRFLEKRAKNKKR